MSLESLGLEGDGGIGMSPEQMEKLGEQIRENQAQIKALKKQEGSQRAKDNKLVEILMKFVKGSSNSGLVALIVRLLDENVPAGFILAIILLSNEDIQAEMGIKLLLLNSGVQEQISPDSEQNIAQQNYQITLKLWTEAVIIAALENPYKIFRTVRDHEGQIKSTVIQLTAFVIRDFFEQKHIPYNDYEEIHHFAHFTMQGVLEQVEKRMEQQQLT